MKRVLKYASLLFAGTAIMVACSKKEDDPTPDVTAESPRIALNLFYNEGDAASTNWGAAEVSANVPNDAPSAVIVVTGDVEKGGVNTSKRELKRLYATKTVDGTTSPFVLKVTGFNSNSDGSIDIPSSGIKKVTVEVPIATPTAGTNTVYEFWFTSGKGDHKVVDKRRQLGQGKVVVNGNALIKYTATIGDQFSAYPSYLVASGTGGALAEVALDTISDATVKQGAYKSVDIVFLQLKTNETSKGEGLKADTTFLVSPNKLLFLNYTGFGVAKFPANTQNYTVYAPYSGDFDAATEADIKALTFTSGVASTQKVVAGGVYKFETTFSEGFTKAGLIKINNIIRVDNGLVGGNQTAGVFTRSANVTIKAVSKSTKSSSYTSTF